MAEQHSNTERWLPICVRPDYEISNQGRIRHKGFFLKPYVCKSSGYAYIKITICSKRKKLYVHRLVATAFLGDPTKELPHVNHIDTIRSNNVVTNLEWTDRSGNMKHAYKMGTRSAIGEASSRTKLTNQNVLEIRRLASEGKTRSELAGLFAMTRGGIDSIVRRVNWKHLP